MRTGKKERNFQGLMECVHASRKKGSPGSDDDNNNQV